MLSVSYGEPKFEETVSGVRERAGDTVSGSPSLAERGARRLLSGGSMN
jgi:hypothetical protein